MKGAEKITKYTSYWKRLQWVAIACRALTVAIPAAAVCWFLTEERALSLGLLGITLLLAVYLFYRQTGVGQLSEARVVSLFNQKYSSLEYSSQLLLLNPLQLSIPARLQRRKVEEQISRQKLKRPPVRLTDAFLWLVLSLLLSNLLLYFAGSLRQPFLPEGKAEASLSHPADTVYTETLQQQIPALEEGRLLVSPPAYTRQQPYYTELASLRAPEESRLTWQLEFSAPVEQLWLSLSSGDSLPFRRTSKGKYTAQLLLQKSILYQLAWRHSEGEEQATEYLRLEAVRDDAAELFIQQPEQYIRQDKPYSIHFRAEAKDDYGLTDAYLQLTISQGSGENVTFREEKLWFENDFSGQPPGVQLEKELDPRSLGMQPGDELYYHLVAFDNRQPQKQRSRTETWFYHWLDTANQSAFEMGGMAMDIMPDYFRSQRQIIIDTEKLIKERPELSEEDFEKRGNNLGVDQKLLRLRYGKFLGEEFESDAGEAGHRAEEHEAHEGHEEHGDEEEGHEEEGALPGEVDHDHNVPAHEEPVSPSAANLLQEFMHAHDTEEGATFYEESIKVKLKAALAEMWESELRLRTLRPKEALPYQHRALEIIKGVQQATRIYVERIGFEPPPLKPAERRLTGELEEVASVEQSAYYEPADSLEAIKRLALLLQAEEPPGKEIAREAGQELAAIVEQHPGPAYLQSLKLIGKLLKEEGLEKKEKESLLRSLYELLPETGPVLQKGRAYRSSTERDFMRKIGGMRE